MSQPPPYNRSFSFSSFQAQNPTGVPPGSSMDLELNNVKSSIDGIESNLARIQRDDGALMNGSVTYDTLSPSLQTAGIAPALPWVTGTVYSGGASVTHGSAFYRCLNAHTSGVFATDLAAGNWILIVDFSTIALVAASMIAVTPSGSLTTNVQTSLQALDAGKAPLNHTQLSTTISDSTTAGRALLTAADATAQNALLGTTLLGFQPGDIKETACPVPQSGWYYCDGSAKNRVTDINLFNAITIQQSGTLVGTAFTITGLSDTSGLSPGMPISGPGIQSGTVIQSVDSASQVTMSLAATSGGTTTFVFAPYGVGDGSTSFNLPNRALVGVGRDNASGSASNATQVSTTITLTSGSAVGTVANSTGVFAGMHVSHPKLAIGTTLLAVSGNTVTFNSLASGTVSGSAVRFSPLLEAQTLGSRGGSLSWANTLVTANLPAYTPSGAVAVTIPVYTSAGVTQGGTTVSNAVSLANSANNNAGTLNVAGTGGASSFTGNAQGGTSTPFLSATMQPTVVMNYIIKR